MVNVGGGDKKSKTNLVRTFREEPLGLTHLKGLSSPSVLSSTFCLFSAASALLLSISSFIFLFSSWKRKKKKKRHVSQISKIIACQQAGAVSLVVLSNFCGAFVGKLFPNVSRSSIHAYSLAISVPLSATWWEMWDYGTKMAQQKV